MKMTMEGIIRTLYRRGYYIIPNKEEFTLQQIEELEDIAVFGLKLERSALKPDDWVLICKDICGERSNCFWHGQNAGGSTINDPIKWIYAWENRSTP